jgi:hypothetical protein
MLTRIKKAKKYGKVKENRLIGETTTTAMKTVDTHMEIR